MTLPLYTESDDIRWLEHDIVTEWGGELHHGYVMTVDGIVIVRSVMWGDGDGYTELQMIHDQLRWERRYDRQFKPRYLVTLAKRFARDVAAQG
jgi:hypothetical protein